MSTGTAHALAEYVHDLRATALPDETREAAARCVLDLLGAAAAGYADAGVAATRAVALGVYAPGSADIWFTGRTSSANAAVLSNSAAGAALDLDDGFRAARGHPGAAAVPGAWASLGADHAADDLLEAIVAGYEVGIRMAMGRLQYAPSGAWSPYAVIAAAGKLMACSPVVMANAFGIAAQSAPALPGLAGLMGSDVKEGIPWGSLTGLTALQLAQQGFTGPTQILDEPGLFAPERIRAGLGNAPLIHGTYFKLYACCRHMHAALDAYAALSAQNAFRASDVQEVEVRTYHATFNLSNRPAPRTLVEAQYSTPFCLAACAVRGPESLLPMRPELLNDADVLAFAQRVMVSHDLDIEALFPARSPAQVNVKTARGVFRSQLTDPRGDPLTPLSWSELEAKFTTATRDALSVDRQELILSGVRRWHAGDLQNLRNAVRAPLERGHLVDNREAGNALQAG